MSDDAIVPRRPRRERSSRANRFFRSSSSKVSSLTTGGGGGGGGGSGVEKIPPMSVPFVVEVNCWASTKNPAGIGGVGCSLDARVLFDDAFIERWFSKVKYYFLFFNFDP